MSDTLRAAAQQALEALDEFMADYQSDDGMNSMKHYAKEHHAAITALRAALAEPAVKDSLTVADTLPSLDRADWLADKLHNGGDYGKEAAALLMKQAREIERLTAALAAAVADTDAELERRTGEPHIDGWPLYSGLPPPQREPQWQPIETAPKDGTRVLIYMPESSSRKVQEAYWATPWEGAPDEQCWWSTPFGPAGRGYTILPVAVTHWMPLPDAPASAPKEQA